MIEQQMPGVAAAPPPEQWRQAWQDRSQRNAPARINHGDGSSTAYWSGANKQGALDKLGGFGLWHTVALDTFLMFVAEIGLSVVLAVLALFVFVIHGGYLHAGLSVGGAETSAWGATVHWLQSPVGIACGALATQAGILLVLQFRVVLRDLLSWTALLGAPLARLLGRGGATAVDAGATVPVIGAAMALLWGLGLGLLAFFVGEALLVLLHALGADVQGQARSFGSVRHATAGELIPFVLTTVLTAPLAEELFFRAYALRALSVRYGLARGLLFSSALFAALHIAGDPSVGWEVVPLFAIGLILGWGYARTGTLIADVTAHAVNNAIGVVLLIHGNG